MHDQNHPYLTEDIAGAIEHILATAAHALTAGLESNPERAYERLMHCFHELSNSQFALFAALHVECPECGNKSAQSQACDCPCCGTLNSCIPRHLFAQIDAIWQTPGSVVPCPVCDGECDVAVDGVADRCPACGGAGATCKEDALCVIREMHYEAQGLYTDDDDDGGQDDA
jgi:hypothetical protein